MTDHSEKTDQNHKSLDELIEINDENTLKVISLPEYGYTPANYQALVELTKLKPKGFYKQFDIAERTFFNHRSGERTMSWQEWQSLVENVKQYLELKQNMPADNHLNK